MESEPGRGGQISLVQDDSLGGLLGFKRIVIHDEYKLSDNSVDISSFEEIFLETDIAQGITYKRKRPGIFHNFTINVSPGFENFEKFRGGVQQYMMESTDFISSINFKIKIANSKLVSFKGQRISFR